MAPPPDYYEVLQVSPNADGEVVEAVYKRLVDKWHAGRRPGDPTAFERLSLLDDAYAVLSDPQRRQGYDSRRRQTAATAGERPPPAATEAQPAGVTHAVR